jgi:hypothetical protein
MKSSIVIVAIGLGIGFVACTADLRDNNVCVMYQRALCNKAASCGMLNNQTAEQCLAPYIDDLCKNSEGPSGSIDVRACGAAIDDAPCPGDTPVPLPDCQRNLSKDDLNNVGKPGNAGGAGGSGGSGGSGATGGSGGSGGTGARGGSGGSGGAGGSTGGSGGVGGSTGGSSGVGGSTGGSGGVGGSTGGSGGVGGATGGSGGTSSTGTCTSYVADSTYPCAMMIPDGCGTNPISCGNGTSCVANSTCVANMQCQCITNYLAVSCATGMRCMGCAASTWGCTPKPNPGCTGNPYQTAGVCTCSNGKTFNLTCGTSVSCDQRCRQGF